MSDLNKILTEELGEAPQFLFATIDEIDADKGITLLFDGYSSATTKYYKCNKGVAFAEGDRVKVLKDSGTYVVEYPIGLPEGRATTFNFKINGTTYKCEDNTSAASWVGTQYNVDSFTVGSEYPNGAFFYQNGIKMAHFGSLSSNYIIPNKNYTNTPLSFQINGTTYQFWEEQTGQEWSNSAYNTDGLYVQSGTPSGYTYGYYFCTSSSISTAVARLGQSSSTVIQANHNYTMAG